MASNIKSNVAKRTAARKAQQKATPVKKVVAKKPVAKKPTVNALKSRGAAAKQKLGGAPAPNPGAVATNRKVFTVNSRTAENLAAQQAATYRANLAQKQSTFLDDIGKRLGATVAANAELLRTEQAKLPQVNEAATGEERAAQNEQLQRIADANFKYNQALKSLETNNRLRGQFSADEQAAGQQGIQAVNPIKDTGKRQFATDANGNPIEQGGPLGDMGEMEKSARERLTGEGIVGVPQTQQVEAGKAQAGAVMTYSGTPGVSYDPSSQGPVSANAIGAFGAGRGRAQAEQEKENARIEFEAARNEASRTGKYFDATKARENMENRFAEIDAQYSTTPKETTPGEGEAGVSIPGEGGAAGTTTGGKPVPDPSGFLAGLDATERGAAAAELAPLFDFVRTAYAGMQEGAGGTRDMISTLDQETKDFTDIKRAQDGILSAAHEAMLAGQRDEMLKSAKRTYESQQAIAELERRRAETEFNRAIRDQIIQNEEDREMAFLGNGISGGWRSSLHTSRMINALKKGETIVADLKADKAFSGEIYAQKALGIESEYHGNVTGAYNAYNVAMTQLFERMDDKAAALDKTVFDSKQGSKKALNDLEKELFKETANLIGNTTTQVINYQNTAKAQARQARQDMYGRQKDLTGEFFDGLDRGLHADNRWYNQMKAKFEALGMTPPPQGMVTDEQRKAMKDSVDAKRYEPGQFVVGDVSYGDIINSVASKIAQDGQRGEFKNANFSLLESGNYNSAIANAISVGVRNLGVTTNKSFVGFDVGIAQSTLALERARELGAEAMSAGKWKTFWENTVKTQFQDPKDTEWLQFMQDMMLSQEDWRHSITGAQFTISEQERVGVYLFKNDDTVKDAVTKMAGLRAFMTLQRNIYANDALSGIGVSRYSDEEIFGDVNAEIRFDEYDRIMNEQESGEGEETSSDYTTTPGVYEDSLPITQKDFSGWVGKIGSVTQDFYEPTDYIAGRNTHGGLDIAGKKGQSILPPVGGQIVKVEEGDSGWGKHVVWKDGVGNMHLAAHLDSIPDWMLEQYERREPVFISKADAIGTMGSTGYSTGPHLHYEIRNKNGQLLNPYDYFSLT